MKNIIYIYFLIVNILFLLSCQLSIAQTQQQTFDPKEIILKIRKTGTCYFDTTKHELIQLIANDTTVNQFKSLFGLGEYDSLIVVFQSEKEHKYEIFHKGVKVENQSVRIFLKNNLPVRVSIPTKILHKDYKPLNLTYKKPTLTPEEAFKIALKEVPSEQYRWQKWNESPPKPKLLWKADYGHNLAKTQFYYIYKRLAYKIKIISFLPKISSRLLYIDPYTGKILENKDGMNYQSVPFIKGQENIPMYTDKQLPERQNDVTTWYYEEHKTLKPIRLIEKQAYSPLYMQNTKRRYLQFAPKIEGTDSLEIEITSNKGNVSPNGQLAIIYNHRIVHLDRPPPPKPLPKVYSFSPFSNRKSVDTIRVYNQSGEVILKKPIHERKNSMAITDDGKFVAYGMKHHIYHSMGDTAYIFFYNTSGDLIKREQQGFTRNHKAGISPTGFFVFIGFTHEDRRDVRILIYDQDFKKVVEHKFKDWLSGTSYGGKFTIPAGIKALTFIGDKQFQIVNEMAKNKEYLYNQIYTFDLTGKIVKQETITIERN